MMMIGRAGGVGLLKKAFATDDYTKEDLQYVPDVLRHCSRKTLWRTFDSCNNYKVPEPVPQIDTKLHYWYTKDEEKERKKDKSWDLPADGDCFCQIYGMIQFRITPNVKEIS